MNSAQAPHESTNEEWIYGFLIAEPFQAPDSFGPTRLWLFSASSKTSVNLQVRNTWLIKTHLLPGIGVPALVPDVSMRLHILMLRFYFAKWVIPSTYWLNDCRGELPQFRSCGACRQETAVIRYTTLPDGVKVHVELLGSSPTALRPGNRSYRFVRRTNNSRSDS